MFRFCQKNKKGGVIILEILVVLSVLGLLVAVVIPQFTKIRERQVFKNTINDVVSAMYNAQSNSLASLGSSEYGVRFESDRVIIFTGKVFSSGNASNIIINIVSPASISNVTLSGVSSSAGDFYFERLSGLPSQGGTITISTPSSSKTITISTNGTFY